MTSEEKKLKKSSHGGVARAAKIVLAILAGSVVSLAADGHVQGSLATAMALEAAGEPARAIAVAQSLIDARALSTADTARALEAEGTSYRDMSELEKAARALKQAQQLLEPKDSSELANVLNNLGRVYTGKGEGKRASPLYERAFAMEERLGDHRGMAGVANNQAGLALNERRDGEARAFLKRAESEAKQAANMDDDTLASIASMKGWLARSEGNDEAALSEYQNALQLWKDAHGERHPVTAWGLLLVGQAQTKTGDWKQGLQNMHDGVALLSATLGERSQRYAAAEMAYAGALEQAGERIQASRLRMDVQARQPLQQEPSCADCAVDTMLLH